MKKTPEQSKEFVHELMDLIGPSAIAALGEHADRGYDLDDAFIRVKLRPATHVDIVSRSGVVALLKRHGQHRLAEDVRTIELADDVYWFGVIDPTDETLHVTQAQIYESSTERGVS